jgi:hypothetical protein
VNQYSAILPILALSALNYGVDGGAKDIFKIVKQKMLDDMKSTILSDNVDVKAQASQCQKHFTLLIN